MRAAAQVPLRLMPA